MALGGSEVIELKLAAAKNRVAFAVIDVKSTAIQDAAVLELSAALSAMAEPVLSELRTVNEFTADMVQSVKWPSRSVNKV